MMTPPENHAQWSATDPASRPARGSPFWRSWPPGRPSRRSVSGDKTGLAKNAADSGSEAQSVCSSEATGAPSLQMGLVLPLFTELAFAEAPVGSPLESPLLGLPTRISPEDTS